jgi:hypothetical protein
MSAIAIGLGLASLGGIIALFWWLLSQDGRDGRGPRR